MLTCLCLSDCLLRWSCSLRSPARLLRLKGVRLPFACVGSPVGGSPVWVRLCGFRHHNLPYRCGCGGRARYARPPACFASRGFACRSPVWVRLWGVRLCGFACVGFGITIDQIPNRSQITICHIDAVAVVVLASLALPCASPCVGSPAVRLWGLGSGGAPVWVRLCGFA